MRDQERVRDGNCLNDMVPKEAATLEGISSSTTDVHESGINVHNQTEDWVEMADKSGAPIFVNRSTGAVRGQRSNPITTVDDGDNSRTSWNAVTDILSGNKYYRHERTGVTSFRPYPVPKNIRGDDTASAILPTASLPRVFPPRVPPGEFDANVDKPRTWNMRQLEDQFGPLIREGWLSLRKSVKKSHIFGNWGKRWVELRRGGLSVWNRQPRQLRTDDGSSSSSTSSSSSLSPKRVVRFTAETKHEAMIIERANSREKIGIVLSGHVCDIPLYMTSLEESKAAADKEAFDWNDDVRRCLKMFSADRTEALVRDVETLRGDMLFWRESIATLLSPGVFWDALSKTIDNFTVADAEIVRGTLTSNQMGEEDDYDREAALLDALFPQTPASDGVLNLIQSMLVEEVDAYRQTNQMTLPQVKLMLASKTEGSKHILARWL